VDAERRDFTINTLLATPDGAVFDPTGQGLADLDARRVVFVGEPAARIAEDFLRIFRFFRFHAQYGEGAPDAAALKACGELAHNIASLSKERITQEFVKIMAVPDPSATLQFMVKNGVTPCLEKTFKETVLRSLCELQVRHDAKDVMARLLAIGDMKPNYFEDGLMLSNAQKKHLESLALGLALLKRPTKKKLRELIYRIGNQMALQTYLLKLVQKNDLPNLELLDIARYWQAPEFPIKAAQLMDAGVPQGPMLGKRLKELEDKWIAKDFPAHFTAKK
jgi:poly(A) polymerase